MNGSYSKFDKNGIVILWAVVKEEMAVIGLKTDYRMLDHTSVFAPSPQVPADRVRIPRSPCGSANHAEAME